MCVVCLGTDVDKEKDHRRRLVCLMMAVYCLSPVRDGGHKCDGFVYVGVGVCVCVC